MDEEINVSVVVGQLKEAGSDPSRQIRPLLQLADWYLREFRTNASCADATKANALYNAALVRSNLVNYEVGEDGIIPRIVETYRAFSSTFTNDEDVDEDEIRYEICSHKEFIAKERRMLKERVDHHHHEIHSHEIYDIFRDIEDMYKRLVSMLVKECEGRLGRPPCDYAIIALGSVARMEATPFSDLEFVILYADPTIGEKINYFRVLTHFLHLKVINLGETILPALGIKQLNDFQSSDPDGSWFYDSETPRGISFDGAMPWASKTALGRMATKNKPALELIKTPEDLAELQDEEISLKEGYHLADILSRVSLLFGEQALLDEYNERVAEKLNTKSSAAKDDSRVTVGFTRGIHQMILDLDTYDPYKHYLGSHCTVGAIFDAKKEFYRVISLLLFDLGLIFDIRSPSPWHVIGDLCTRGVIDESDKASIKECLSIANEIRLKAYYAYNKQKELLSPIPRYSSTTKQLTEELIFNEFNEDILVHFLSTSNDIHTRCLKFCLKFNQEGEIDDSLLRSPSPESSKAKLFGHLYLRLQHFDKALEWYKSDSTDEFGSLCGQATIYCQYGDYTKSIECFEKALEIYSQNEDPSDPGLLACINNFAMALRETGQINKAGKMIKKAIEKHQNAYGEDSDTVFLSTLMLNLGLIYSSDDPKAAVETFEGVEEMQNKLMKVPDQCAIGLNLSMACSLSRLDQHKRSLEYLERALQLGHQVFGQDYQSSELSMIYKAAGDVYENSNQYNEALSWYMRSLELLQLVFRDTLHPGKIDRLKSLGIVYFRMDKKDKAVEFLDEALEHARKFYGDKPQLALVEALISLGVVLRTQNVDLERCLQYFEEAKKLMYEILGPNHAHSYTSVICRNMAEIFYELDDLAMAQQYFQDAFNMNFLICDEGNINDSMVAVCSNLGVLSEKTGNLNEAKKYYCEGVKILNKLVSLGKKIDFVDFLSNLYKLSLVCQALEQDDEALKLLQEAVEIKTAVGSENLRTCDLMLKLNTDFEIGSFAKILDYLHIYRQQNK